MKLIFFVIAFCLVCIRVYFSWAHSEPQNNHKGEIVIQGAGLDMRMEWLGQIRLNEQETGIAQMSPGGYVKYLKNDTQVIAESNVKGLITYGFPGNEQLSDSGKALLLQQAIHELVTHGFDAKNRMERLYAMGGYPALITEFPNLKIDNLQQLYLDRIMQSDSLSATQVVSMLEKMRHGMREEEQQKFLLKLKPAQLDSPAIRKAIFQSVDSMQNTDIRHHLLAELLTRSSLPDSLVDQIAASAGRLPGDFEKQDIYLHLIDRASLGEDQWKTLLEATHSLAGDQQKSEVLIAIARKMPRKEELLLQYRSIAKSISSDIDYGKAIRAID